MRRLKGDTDAFRKAKEPRRWQKRGKLMCYLQVSACRPVRLARHPDICHLENEDVTTQASAGDFTYLGENQTAPLAVRLGRTLRCMGPTTSISSQTLVSVGRGRNRYKLQGKTGIGGE